MHLLDGSATFVAMKAVVEGDQTVNGTFYADGTVLFATPGFDTNGLPTITCTNTSPVSGITALVTGYIAPSWSTKTEHRLTRPTLRTAVSAWSPGDTIPLGRDRTLSVTEVRDAGEPDGNPVLAVSQLDGAGTAGVSAGVGR